MPARFDVGESVPDGLFDVDGDRDASLEFGVGVRVERRGGLRHVIPDERIHHVREAVRVTSGNLTHATVFEGPNTVLYFAPADV